MENENIRGEKAIQRIFESGGRKNLLYLVNNPESVRILGLLNKGPISNSVLSEVLKREYEEHLKRPYAELEENLIEQGIIQKRGNQVSLTEKGREFYGLVMKIAD